MDFWVFGYGSLMWRPNFRYVEAVSALLEGAHRALCVYSVVHRGVHTSPGLVLGLDRGGQCKGMAFRVAAEDVHSTRLYLRRRENVTNTYAAITRPVKLLDGSTRAVTALAYFVNRNHRQYAKDLPLEKQAHIVRKSAGASGTNIDYVVNTVEHLRALGVHDARLELLMARLGYSVLKTKCRNSPG